jgi:general secretion pathway protein J
MTDTRGASRPSATGRGATAAAGRASSGGCAPATSGCGGFTLVELLVAMTLLGLIFVALFGGLRFGTRVWETGNAQSERIAEVEIAQSLLRRLLRQAFVPDAAEGVGTVRGEADRLAFTAPAPSRFLLGGIYLYEVFVEEHDDGGDLGISWMLYPLRGLCRRTR